jgi:ATP-binding cassette subfamily A (ABC1) protein 3
MFYVFFFRNFDFNKVSIFQPSYWFPSLKKNVADNSYRSELSEADKTFFEPEPLEVEAGIEINNLRKVFHSFTGTEIVAVDSVGFKAYHGQITALLGHNGAGKTTTMNVLTGMMSASGGTALINGFSIHGQMDSVRKSLGLCPQHNMLFMDLTVEEHLIFFGMLKGISMQEAKRQAKTYIEQLDLTGKKNAKAETLSGIIIYI